MPPSRVATARISINPSNQRQERDRGTEGEVVDRHSSNLRALVDTFNGRSDAVAACGVFEHPVK